MLYAGCTVMSTPSKTLLNYINSELAKGNLEADIRTQTLAAGWPPAMVNQAFDFLKTPDNATRAADAVSLQKRSWAFSLLRLGYAFLALIFTARVIIMMGVFIILEHTLESSVPGSLPFEILSYHGWFFPSILAVCFMASLLSLWSFFAVSKRTQKAWRKSLIVLILLLVLYITLVYLLGTFSTGVTDLTNNF